MPARPRLASTSSASGPATARSRSRTGLLEPRTSTASPGSPSTRALATPRPLGHGNGCAATASARRLAGRAPGLAPAVVVAGRGGPTEAQGERRVHRGGDVRRVGPLAALRHHLDAHLGSTQERPDRAGQGRPADHDDAVRSVGVEPVGGREQQGAVGHGLGPDGRAAERLGHDGVPALGRPGDGTFTESGVAGVADDDEGAGDLGQRGGRSWSRPRCRPRAPRSPSAGLEASRPRRASSGRRRVCRGRPGASGSRRQTLRCTGPGTPPVAPVAAASGAADGAAPERAEPGARDRSREVDRRTGSRDPKMPGCSVVWLAPVPRSSCGRSALTTTSGTPAWWASSTAGCRLATAVPDVVTTATGCTGAAGQAEREEPGAALVDPHVEAEPPARARPRARHTPAVPTGSRGRARPRGRRCVPARRRGRSPARGRVHGRGVCHPLSTRSSDTERTGRPEHPARRGLPGVEAGDRAARCALGDPQGGDVALERGGCRRRPAAPRPGVRRVTHEPRSGLGLGRAAARGRRRARRTAPAWSAARGTARPVTRSSRRGVTRWRE